MRRVKLYMCDGDVPGCRKTYCAFNGTGDCCHTEDKSHARYEPPRRWDVMDLGDRTVLVEKAREKW